MLCLLSMKLRFLVAALAIAASALAADPTGKWNGKIVLDIPAGTKIPDEAKAQLETAKKSLAKTKLSLELKADKSYTSKLTNGPDGKDHAAEGKWSQAGSTVTLKPSKRDGKAASGKEAEPQTLTISADGKTMTRTIQGVKIILTKS